MTSVSLKDYIRELSQLLDQEAYEEVIGHGRHILQHFPKHVATYEMLGQALFHKRRYDEAEQVFLRLLTATPGNFVAHVTLAEIYQERSDTVRALWHLEIALDQRPNQTNLMNELRVLYQQRHGHSPDKIQLTQPALARQYLNSGMYEQAISELYAVIQQEPSRYDLRVLLMDAFWEADYLAEAGHVALDLLKHLPDCLPANRLMTQLWILSRRPEEARPFLRRVEALAPYQSMELLYRTLDPSSAVPDGGFSLPRLDWSAASSAFVETSTPDWFSDLGRAFEGEAAGPLDAQPDGAPPADVPDWVGGQEEAQAADLPDWYTPATSEFGTGSLKQRGNTDKLESPDDWFADMTSSVQAPEPVTDESDYGASAGTTSAGESDINFEEWFGDAESFSSTEGGLGGTDELPPMPQDDSPEDLAFLVDDDDNQSIDDDFLAASQPQSDASRQSTGFTDLLGDQFGESDSAATEDDFGTPDFDFFDTSAEQDEQQMPDDVPDVDWLAGDDSRAGASSAATGFTGLLDDQFAAARNDQDDLAAFLDSQDDEPEPRQRTGVTDELLFGGDDTDADDDLSLPDFELESNPDDEMSWLLEDDSDELEESGPVATGITSELLGSADDADEPDFLDFDPGDADEADLDWLLGDDEMLAPATSEGERVRTGLTDELIGVDDDDEDLGTLRDATRPPSPEEVAALMAAARGESSSETADDDDDDALARLFDDEEPATMSADESGTSFDDLFADEAPSAEDDSPAWMRETVASGTNETADEDFGDLFADDADDDDALAGLFGDGEEPVAMSEGVSDEGFYDLFADDADEAPSAEDDSPAWMRETIASGTNETADEDFGDLFADDADDDDALAGLFDDEEPVTMSAGESGEDFGDLFADDADDDDALAGLFDDEEPVAMSADESGEGFDDLFADDDYDDALAGLFDDADDAPESDRVSTGMTGELLNRFEDADTSAADDGGRVSTGMTAMLMGDFDDDEGTDDDEGRISTGLTGTLVSEFDDDDLSAILDDDFDDDASDGETILFLDEEEVDRDVLRQAAAESASDVPDWLTQGTDDDEFADDDDIDADFNVNLDLNNWATEPQNVVEDEQGDDIPDWLASMELSDNNEQPAEAEATLDFMAEPQAGDDGDFEWMSAFDDEPEPEPAVADVESDEEVALDLDDILDLDTDAAADTEAMPDESLAASEDLSDTKQSESTSGQRFEFKKPPRWMRRQSGGTDD